MSHRRRTAQVVTLLTLLAIWPAAAQARNYGRSNYNAAARQRLIQAAQSQIAAARKVQGMAQIQMSEAQGKVDDCNARIRNAKSSMDSAKSDEHNSHLSLVEIQTKLIEEAGPKSEIGKSYADLLAAEAEFDDAHKRVLNSDGYKAKVAEITDPSDRLKRLPELREEAFKNDDDYQNKLKRLKLEKFRFGQLRTEMVRNSSEWSSMSDEVREALKSQNKAEVEAIGGGSAKMRAKYRLHDAQQAYAAATATINQCEGILRRLGVKPPPAPPSSTPSSAGS